jgi:hypothetical protein
MAGYSIEANNIKEQLPDFIQWLFTEDRIGTQDWSSHIKEAYSGECLYVTYEDLHRDAIGVLAGLFSKVNGSSKINIKKLAAVVEARSMANVRSVGNSLHKRKGVTGEWKKYFDSKARNIFCEYGQHALEIAGYESNKDWIDFKN